MKRYNILFGGKAGQGPNFLADLISKLISEQGYYVFNSRDYQSLIRGGHNFNLVTFSDSPVLSNDSFLDILVCIDENTLKLHKKELLRGGRVLSGKSNNMYYAGSIVKLLGIPFEKLNSELKSIGRKYEENLENAKKGYSEETNSLCDLSNENKKVRLMSGSTGICEGAIKAGLDTYYGYPMTPSTPVLRELAQKQYDKNFVVCELENEIAVVHAAIGSAITGAKSMVGTSGGGFDLMGEAISMSAMAEIPLVLYLAQRPGPGTGVPTYNIQGDLNLALNIGHGEFPRVVIAPGDPVQCEEVTSQAFYFSQEYRTPVVVLSDKHLSESYYSLTEFPQIEKSKKKINFTKFNSYEHDELGISTEDPKLIVKNTIQRIKKSYKMLKETKKFKPYRIYGKNKTQNLIVSWGSTKGAILDAIENEDVNFLQIIYMEPFPKKDIEKILKDKNIILVENNVTGQLADLISKKTGIFIEDKNKILRYDARPFFCDELKKEVKRRLK